VQRLFFYSHLLESISRVYFFFDAQDVVDELTIRDRLVKAKPEQIQQVGHVDRCAQSARSLDIRERCVLSCSFVR